MHIDEAVVQHGAARFALDPAGLSKIERGGAPDGVVYDYRGEFIVKFVPITPDALPRMEAKLAFVRYLGENGIQAPTPLPSPQGCTMEVISAGSDGSAGSQSWAVTNVRKAPGRHLPPEAWDESFFRAWGRIMGRMHALATRYPASPQIQNWREEMQHFTDGCQDAEIGERWAWLGAQLAALPEDPAAFGLIHNDLHPWNLLVDGVPSLDTITVLDFEVCTYHWFMTDIAIALFHPLWENHQRPADEREAFARNFKRAWLAGYAEEYALPAGWLERLPLFARYRQTLFYLAMSSEYRGNEKAQPYLQLLRQNILEDAPIPALDA